MTPLHLTSFPWSTLVLSRNGNSTRHKSLKTGRKPELGHASCSYPGQESIFYAGSSTSANLVAGLVLPLFCSVSAAQIFEQLLTIDAAEYD